MTNPALNIRKYPSAGLHPAWLRALDETMSIELALEIAEVLGDGAERDLVLYGYQNAEHVQMALDVLDAAAGIIIQIDPARIEHLASTYAHLVWRIGFTEAAEERALLALRINPKNVLALITLAACRNPEKAKEIHEKLLTSRGDVFLPLLLKAVQSRAAKRGAANS